MKPQSSAWAMIWDLDGTLVDTEHQHFAAWVRLCAELGKELSMAEFKPTFGRRNPDILTEWFGPLSPAQLDALSERKEEYFRMALAADAGQGTRIILPGVIALLELASIRGARHAVASSAPPENIEFIVDLVGLRSHFSAFISGTRVPHGKPAPDIFLAAADALHVSASRSLVVEDAAAGVQAARAASMLCLAVTNTVDAVALTAAGATRIVARLDDATVSSYVDPNSLFAHTT